MVPLRDLLTERKDPVSASGTLGDWQPITIKFSGDVIPRDRVEAFKGAMFAAYPGDVVFSKIDARNGAVGIIPRSMPKVVVTAEYPVLVPNVSKLSSAYLHYLLRAEHFQHDLQRQASGTSGRKRVTPEAFLSLEVPLPTLDEQDRLVAAYSQAIADGNALDNQARQTLEIAQRAFEDALGVAPRPHVAERPVFVAHFKNLERWSYEGILRAIEKPSQTKAKWPIKALGDLIADLENGWSPQCLTHPAADDKWGVLKVGAVSFGYFNEKENKELPAKLKPMPRYEVKSGDVIISRANVVRYVGACAYVNNVRPKLMLSDKLFRVVFDKKDVLDGQFLAAVMKLPTVREQIESRLTGTSPTMKNISKPALLSLTFPTPDFKTQRDLVRRLQAAAKQADVLVAKAEAKRRDAWIAFESALFEPQENSVQHA